MWFLAHCPGGRYRPWLGGVDGAPSREPMCKKRSRERILWHKHTLIEPSKIVRSKGYLNAGEDDIGGHGMVLPLLR